LAHEKPVQSFMDEETIERLDAAAAKQQRSRSNAIRVAVLEWLSKVETPREVSP
jgi:hypothetical protein